MKVILLQKVPRVGNIGDVVKVADGYARNYLIPKKIAKPATPGNLKNIEHLKKLRLKQDERDRESARELAENLKDYVIILKVKATPAGKLFGSITTGMIAELINKDKGTYIQRKDVLLSENIKEIGEHKVKIRLYQDIETEILVKVESEKEEKEVTPQETRRKKPMFRRKRRGLRTLAELRKEEEREAARQKKLSEKRMGQEETTADIEKSQEQTSKE